MPLHKVLHVLLPILLIVFFSHSSTDLYKFSGLLFLLGFLKELYDGFVLLDPLWISLLDLGANAVGISLGLALAVAWQRLRSTIV